MQSLSATTHAATAVQKPMCKWATHGKSRTQQEGIICRRQKSKLAQALLLLGGTPWYLKKECPMRDAECYKCRKKGHFKGSCRSKKEEMGWSRDIRKNQKLARVLELKAWATADTWTQQYVVQYSTSPQNGTQDATFHHMWTVQVNSLNEQKDIKHICPLWLMTQHNAQVHKFNSEANWG